MTLYLYIFFTPFLLRIYLALLQFRKGHKILDTLSNDQIRKDVDTLKHLIKRTLLVGLGLSSLAMAAPAPSQAADALSGTIEFYTSQPDEDAAKLVEEFNKLYPDVTVNIYRSGTEEVVSKINAEEEAGQVLADVVLLADAVTFEGFKSRDLLLEYRSPETEAIDSQYVDDYYTGTKTLATGIIYNTDAITEAPDSWNLFTDEASKDAFAMPSPLYSGAAAYNLGVLTRNEAFGWDFYQQIKANQPMVTKGNGGVLESVASGERSFGMIVDYLVQRAAKDGAPVAFAYPKEGVPVITEPIGIMAATEEEEIAKAFVDFLLSEAGQTLQADLGYAPIRQGIEAPEGLRSVDEIDAVLSADMKELFENREADKEAFDKLFAE